MLRTLISKIILDISLSNIERTDHDVSRIIIRLKCKENNFTWPAKDSFRSENDILGNIQHLKHAEKIKIVLFKFHHCTLSRLWSAQLLNTQNKGQNITLILIGLKDYLRY